MGNEVKRCEVCGESECWALADWSMGGAPGEYEEAMAKHYRLGYEREKARADAAEEALAAARRENDDLTGRAMIRNGFLRAALERIAAGTGDPKEVARTALAAPAAGEEGQR